MSKDKSNLLYRVTLAMQLEMCNRAEDLRATLEDGEEIDIDDPLLDEVTIFEDAADALQDVLDLIRIVR